MKKYPSVINVAIYERYIEIIARFIRGGLNLNIGSYYPGMDVVLPFEATVYREHIYAVKMFLISGCSRGVHILDKYSTINGNIGRKMQELLGEWNVYENNVLPLQQRCRMMILTHLSLQADKKINELPLPPQLIEYLSIPELDDIIETCKPPSHYVM